MEVRERTSENETEERFISMKVDLGKIVLTAGVAGWVMKNPATIANERKSVVSKLLDRHKSGDWGELDAEDAKLNDDSAKTGGRLLSSYPIDATNLYEGREDKLWIITEWDRSVTTLLFPSEY